MSSQATSPAARTRDPDQTRRQILEAAFEEIQAQGFRKASIDRILQRTGVTKGALYHHFPNKAALGHAVLGELVVPSAYRDWKPITDTSLDPIDALLSILARLQEERLEQYLYMGCPINGLVQEMSGVDEEFRKRLLRILDDWVGAIRRALERGQREGSVRGDLDATDTARMIVSTFEGCTGFAKCSQDAKVYRDCVQSLMRFCEGLRQV